MKGIDFEVGQCEYLYNLLQEQIKHFDPETVFAQSWKQQRFYMNVKDMQEKIKEHALEEYSIEI